MSRLEKSYAVGTGLQDILPPPIQAGAAPASTDIKFPLGQVWLDTVNGFSYILAKKASGSATWNAMAPGASDVDTLSGDSGGARPPTAGDMIIAGGTNITSAGAASTITINMDAAITLATSVTSPIYTSDAGLAINMPAGAFDLTIKLADDAGAQKLSFTDAASAEIASLDSDGAFSLLAGDLAVTRSSAALEVLCDVTNSDNTSVDSDAYFEAAVGGTSSGNPGIRFQISGGQNYSMGIDNADSDKLVISADNDLGTDVLMKMDETTKDVEVSQGNLVIGAVAKQLQMNGGAVTDFIGNATLVAGTVTISNTNIAANDRIFCTGSALNGSPGLGFLYTTITPGVSFTVGSFTGASGEAKTNDVSSFSYFIVRQN